MQIFQSRQLFCLLFNPIRRYYQRRYLDSVLFRREFLVFVIPLERLTMDEMAPRGETHHGARCRRRIFEKGRIIRQEVKTMKLYVGNLSYSATENELRELFGNHGQVTSVAVITDRETGRAKGFGFVEFASDEEGKAAIAALDGKEVGGRSLKVNEARPQGGGGGGFGGGERRSGGGGFGGGGGERRGGSGGGGGSWRR
jgi:cold-inducible RNA-binding protein